MRNKIFDLHGDIGMYLNQHKEKGALKSIITNQNKGGLTSNVMACCFEGKEDYDFMLKNIKRVKQEIELNGLNLVLNNHDLKKSENTIISIEGMCGVTKLEDLQTFFDLGVRVASLCWNDANKLAGGSENPKQGLTELGEEVIKSMNHMGMIIDVSHANEKSFWDIIKTSKKAVIATHSNAYALCENERNLKDEQLIAIKKSGGIVGLVAWNLFIDGSTSNKLNIDKFIEHIKYVGDLIGYDSICLGLDLCDYYLKDSLENFDVKSANKIIPALIKTGISEKIVEDICFNNAYQFFKKNLK